MAHGIVGKYRAVQDLAILERPSSSTVDDKCTGVDVPAGDEIDVLEVTTSGPGPRLGYIWGRIASPHSGWIALSAAPGVGHFAVRHAPRMARIPEPRSASGLLDASGTSSLLEPLGETRSKKSSAVHGDVGRYRALQDLAVFQRPGEDDGDVSDAVVEKGCDVEVTEVSRSGPGPCFGYVWGRISSPRAGWIPLSAGPGVGLFAARRVPR